MAEITETYPESIAGDQGTVLWKTVTCGDTGRAVELKDFNDNTVQVTGTFNSQTLTIQGSNDNTTWFTLKLFTGVVAEFTEAGGGLIAEAPRYIRPSFSGSTGGELDVYLQLRKA